MRADDCWMTFGTVEAYYIIPVIGILHSVSTAHGWDVTLDNGYDRWGCQGQGHKPGEGTRNRW